MRGKLHFAPEGFQEVNVRDLHESALSVKELFVLRGVLSETADSVIARRSYDESNVELVC